MQPSMQASIEAEERALIRAFALSMSDSISVTPTRAAGCTGLSRTRVFNAIRAGELTARKDGKATVIEISELFRWVKSLPTRGREPATA